MSEQATLALEGVATEWRELEVGGVRVRYRFDGAEHAHFSAGYDLEHFHAGEWRRVENWNSRDWFVLGLLAAPTPVEEEEK